MGKIPTMDEMAKQLSEKALDNFLCDGKTLREWMKIITSEDAISRKAVLEWIKGSLEQYANIYSNDMLNMWMLFEEQIKAMPPVTPTCKKGHWISIYGNVKCSVCGNIKDGRSVGKATHYCDFCGAEMESEET